MVWMKKNVTLAQKICKLLIDLGNEHKYYTEGEFATYQLNTAILLNIENNFLEQFDR